MTIETNALNKTRSFVYDAVGKTTRTKDRNARVIQYVYDDLNRLTAEKWLVNASTAPSITIATTTQGGPVNEVQRVGFSDSFSMLVGGTFTLTYDGQTTSAISYNATAAAVKTELEALSNIAAGDVSVTKLTDEMWTQEWQVTFQGGLAGSNVVQTTVDSTNVQGMGTITDIEATDTQGGNQDEVQTVTLSNSTGGTFRLAFDGETTGSIAEDASSADVDSALEALNGVDTVTVTGSAGGPWTITFTGSHSGVNVNQMLGDATALNNGTVDRQIDYTYDAASQLTTVSDPDSEYDYTYDDLGRVLTVDSSDTPNVPDVTPIVLREWSLRRNRPETLHDEFIQRLRDEHVCTEIAEAVWRFFQEWMIVRYPLKATDAISDIVEMEDRELLEDIEAMVQKQFGVQIALPDEYTNETLQQLTILIGRKINAQQQEQPG